MKRAIGIIMFSVFLFSLVFTFSSATIASEEPPELCGTCCVTGNGSLGVVVCDQVFPGVWRMYCTCSASPAQNPNDCPLECVGID